MRFLTLLFSTLILFPSLISAEECPADFKRPSYKTRSAFCQTGEFVSDYYANNAKIKCEDMEVDHLIPLKLAHCAGVAGEKLREFANDERNLKFTYWRTNRQKGAKALGEFSDTLPPAIREKVLIDGLEIMADYDIPIDPSLTKSLISISKSQKIRLNKAVDELPSRKIILRGEFLTPKRAIRKTSSAIATRAGTFAAREIAILPLEHIPFAGLGFALAFIAWDLKDACDTTTELRDLERALFPEDVDLNSGTDVSEVCGLTVPDPDEILKRAADTEYLSALYEDLEQEIGTLGVDLDLPSFPDLPSITDLPNLNDLKKLNPF